MSDVQGWLASGMQPPTPPYEPSAARAAELHSQAMDKLQPPFEDEQEGRALAQAAQFEATMLVYREMRALRKALKRLPQVS